MKHKYVVSLVYTKQNGSLLDIELRMGTVDAISNEEAIGIYI